MKGTGLLALAAVATVTLTAGTAAAQHEGHHTSSDSAAVIAVVVKYHEALATGDSAGALALLTDDAVILESGRVETRAEYRSHHLPADINHARSVKSQRRQVVVRVHHDLAWTASSSTSQGETNGRAVNSTSAEMMILVRTPDGWKISAIHWSSPTRRP